MGNYLGKIVSQPAKQPYRYTPLPDGSIRLLVLLPGRDADDPVRCQLVDYTLRGSGDVPDLYEALSYVWGGPEKPGSIFIGPGFSHRLATTASLHAALLRLRGRTVKRVLWIDAVCINQDDRAEKANQIRLMAEIYCRASRVIIWLGEPDGDEIEALQVIRAAAVAAAGEDDAPEVSNGDTGRQGVISLIRRPWFQRIWVLQEAAAARNILVKHGTAELDGYAFYLGLRWLQRSPGEVLSRRLETVYPAVYLMSGAIFRSKSYATRPSGEASLEIRPLGELVDMYHAHQATNRRDKVFALLGMSSDGDLDAAGLSPDYDIPWGELLRRLIRFALGDHVSIEKTWDDAEMAVIRGEGQVLARVAAVEQSTSPGTGQMVTFVSRDESGNWECESRHALLALAKPVQPDDLVCRLRGATRPVVIRPRKDYFSLVMIAGPPVGVKAAMGGDRAHLSNFQHDFLLVWDWQRSSTGAPDQDEYAPLIADVDGGAAAEQSGEAARGAWETATAITSRIWNAALVCEDGGEYQRATLGFREAVGLFKRCSRVQGPVGCEEELRVREDWANGAAESIRRLVRARAAPQAQGSACDDAAGAKTDFMLLKINQTTEKDLLPAVAWMREEAAKAMKPGPGAEELLRQAVEMRVLEQGADHPDTLGAKEVLAVKCRDVWAKGQAEKLLAEIVEMRERLQGTDHLDTLTAQERLAETTKSFTKASRLFEKVIKARTRLQGADYPDTLASEERLETARIHNADEETPIDTRALQKLIERRIMVQGGGHPDVTRSCANLMSFARDSNFFRESWALGIDMLRGRADVSQASLAEVAQNEDGRMMRLLLEQKGSEIRVTGAVVQGAARNKYAGEEVMEALLDHRGDEVQITEAVLEAAAQTWTSGPGVMRLLFERKEEEIPVITESVVASAAGNVTSAPEVVGLLLDQRSREIRITEDVLKAAVANHASGDRVTRLLFERRRDEARAAITGRVLEAAVAHYNPGRETVRLLLDSKGPDVQATAGLLETAVRNHCDEDTIRLLCEVGGTPVTEGVLKAAAEDTHTFGGQAMQFFLARGVDDALITEDVLATAARHSGEMSSPMTALLTVGERKIRITEAVVRAAKNNAWSLTSLLKMRGKTVVMTDELAIQAEEMIKSKRLGNTVTEALDKPGEVEEEQDEEEDHEGYYEDDYEDDYEDGDEEEGYDGEGDEGGDEEEDGEEGGETTDDGRDDERLY
ncbi:heterokaryon incompatibility protein-domain-containing protein [Diplogelasinospora grovesii]|uniref:Heterokaryon incompatibility protein-domain-containing protein n=1 Tax=Diplogelasinospora grovesii TaxID=303347 RepID=A0AAN6MU60_9PEZI|nr:heterokaryon incompatibility protein-domain-containing protein [Diplogelasinospora grovesii]